MVATEFIAWARARDIRPEEAVSTLLEVMECRRGHTIIGFPSQFSIEPAEDAEMPLSVRIR